MAPDKPTVSSAPFSRADRAEGFTAREPADATGESRDDRFYTHMLTVLSVSSGMVGVCLTAIGLIGILKSLNEIEILVDDLLALATLLFAVAAVLSFLGMRAAATRRWRHFVRVLDVVFSIGLLLVVAATILLTWVVI
jgi:hypothetical protein